MVKVGSPAPHLTLHTPTGEPQPLSALYERNPKTLLVFLRHLGWLPCREHVAQLRDQKAAFDAQEIAIVLVSFASPELAQHWQGATQFPFPLLLDPERRAYAAFGLGSSVLAAWHPKMFLYYFRLLAKGRKLMPVKGDPYQLGGDFLISQQGIVLFAHPSDEPSDRPSVSELLALG